MECFLSMILGLVLVSAGRGLVLCQNFMFSSFFFFYIRHLPVSAGPSLELCCTVIIYKMHLRHCLKQFKNG